MSRFITMSITKLAQYDFLLGPPYFSAEKSASARLPACANPCKKCIFASLVIQSIIISLIFWVFGAHVAFAVPQDMVISEVLFDSAESSDTGAEYIKIKNTGLNDVVLTGWSLFPDGIGYFTFPEFSIVAGGEVKINLRKSGKNDATNLYFDTPTTNMGNSSGSVALFSSTAHNKDTIISYVRYHKPGSGEQKTWESSAVDAKIWTAGSFVDISNATKGQIIFLENIAKKTSAEGWILKSLPSPTPKPVVQKNITAKQGLSAELQKNNINESIQNEKFVLNSDNEDKMFGSKNILWLIFGVGAGILAGALFLVFKKLAIKK